MLVVVLRGYLRKTAVLLCASVLFFASVMTFAAEQRSPQRFKHNRKLETWSFCARIGQSYDHSRYIALYYFSGSFMMLSGNYGQFMQLDMPEKTFRFDGKAFVKPFAKVKHNYRRLNQRFGDNRIRRRPATDAYTIEAAFPAFNAHIRFTPRTDHVDFLSVFEKDTAQAQFDWYLYPDVSVKTVFPDRFDGKAMEGEGHFQQFWGEKGGYNADWIVMHFNNGMVAMLSHFPAALKDEPWLPGDYLMLQNPDGSREKYSRFVYDIREYWLSPRKKSYPTSIAVTQERRAFSVQIDAFTSDQESSAMGARAWIGFARVSGSIGGETVNGWAHMSAWARNRELLE